MHPTSPVHVRDTLKSSLPSYGTIPQCPLSKPPHPPQSSVRFRAAIGLSIPGPGEVDWITMCVVYLTTFISEAARGLLLPSMWPYFRSVGGSKTMLGVFVGMLSTGRMMSTIPLGYLSDSGSMAYVFYATCIMQIAGLALYVLAPSVQGLIVARFITGIGSGTLSVCLAYVTRSVPACERTVHFAYLSAIQFGAFAILPAVGDIFSIVPKLTVLGIAFNGYTYPAAVLIACNTLVLLAVYTLFIDPPRKAAVLSTDSLEQIPSTVVEINPPNTETQSQLDYLPMITCALSNIFLRGAISTLETVATPFLMEQYHITFEQTGLYMTAFGITGLIVFAAFKPLASRVSDRVLVTIGLASTCFAVLPLSISGIGQNLPIALYVILLGLIWSVGYPVGQTGALSLFSKTTQGLPAGGVLGIFNASGSLSRVLFSIADGAIWGYFGREAVFALLLLFGTAALVLVVIAWSRLCESRNQAR